MNRSAWIAIGVLIVGGWAIGLAQDSGQAPATQPGPQIVPAAPLADLQTTAPDSAGELAALRAKLAEARAEAAALAAAREADLARLRTQLDALQKEFFDAKQKLIQAQAERDLAVQQSKLQNEQIDMLRKRLVELAGPARGSSSQPDSGLAGAPTIKAKLTEVSDDQSNATINAGRNDGVEPGMNFVVFRGPTYVGELVITRAEANVAVGKLELLKARAQPGDSAWNKLPE